MGSQREDVECVPVKLHIEDLAANDDVADDGGQDAGATNDEDSAEAQLLAAAQAEVGDNQTRDRNNEEVGDDVYPCQSRECGVVEKGWAVLVGGEGIPVVGQRSAPEKLQQNTRDEAEYGDDCSYLEDDLLLRLRTDKQLRIRGLLS